MIVVKRVGISLNISVLSVQNSLKRSTDQVVNDYEIQRASNWEKNDDYFHTGATLGFHQNFAPLSSFI